MGNYFKVRTRFSNEEIEWRDGELTCREEVKQQILDNAEAVERSGCGLFIGETYVGTKNILENKIKTYALIATIEPVDILEGDFPKLNQGQSDTREDSAEAILLREYGVRFDEEEGRWVTTENDHKVHISAEGVPDKGNPHVLAVMKGEGKKKSEETSAAPSRDAQLKTIKRARNKCEKILQQNEEDKKKRLQRSNRIEELDIWMETAEELRKQHQKKLDAMKGQEDSDEYKEALAKRDKYDQILKDSKEERDKLLEEQSHDDEHAYLDKYEAAARERDAAVLAAYPTAKDCHTREEVEDYLRAKGFFHDQHHAKSATDQRVQLEQMSDENCRAVAEHLDALAEDYPWIVGELGGVRCARKGGGGTWAYTDSYSEVTFNADYFDGQTSLLERDFLRTCDSGFHPPGLTYQSIIDHEMTHAMEQQINRNPVFENDEQYADYEGASDYVMAKVAERMGIGDSEEARQEIRRMVSGYSADNQGVREREDGTIDIDSDYGPNTEFLAEAIAEARCSENPREVSVMVLEEFNNLLDELDFQRKK